MNNFGEIGDHFFFFVKCAHFQVFWKYSGFLYYFLENESHKRVTNINLKIHRWYVYTNSQLLTAKHGRKQRASHHEALSATSTASNINLLAFS